MASEEAKHFSTVVFWGRDKLIGYYRRCFDDDETDSSALNLFHIAELYGRNRLLREFDEDPANVVLVQWRQRLRAGAMDSLGDWAGEPRASEKRVLEGVVEVDDLVYRYQGKLRAWFREEFAQQDVDDCLLNPFVIVDMYGRERLRAEHEQATAEIAACTALGADLSSEWESSFTKRAAKKQRTGGNEFGLRDALEESVGELCVNWPLPQQQIVDVLEGTGSDDSGIVDETMYMGPEEDVENQGGRPATPAAVLAPVIPVYAATSSQPGAVIQREVPVRFVRRPLADRNGRQFGGANPVLQPVLEEIEPVESALVPEQRGGAEEEDTEPVPIDFRQLFSLQLTHTKVNKKFNLERAFYDVKIAKLPQLFDNARSMQLLPEVFRAILDLCTATFQPADRLHIELECRDLNPNIYLQVQRFENFSVEQLMAMMEKLNSSKKFKIDETFKIKLTKATMPVGGGRVHVHTSIDRKRFASSIVSVSVGRNLCLPAALYVAKFRATHACQRGEADYHVYQNLIRKSRSQALEEKAAVMVRQAGMRVGKKFGLDDVDELQRKVFPDFQIVVVSQSHANSVISRSPPFKTKKMKRLYVYHNGDHFDLITTLKGFMMRSYYCHSCELAYNSRTSHRCKGQCNLCYRDNEECEPTQPTFCNECRRCFRNLECFQRHKGHGLYSDCRNIFVCEKCDDLVNFWNRKPEDRVHVCNQIWCRKCSEFTDPTKHQCYLKPLPQKEIEKEPKYLFFDFETWNHPQNGHTPNLVIAQYADGTEFRFPKDGSPMTEDVGKEFGEWLFHERNRGFTIFAHNFRSYDGHFLLKYMLDNNLRPQVIKRGTQLLELSYPALKIKARDTLNFCALKLSAFAKAVGLDLVVQKGEFPHHLNRPENWDTLVKPFPALNEYMIDSLGSAEWEKFEQWRDEEAERKKNEFDFRREIVDYCSTDVTVLRLCAMKFRADFISLCNIDPYVSVTIAAACQAYYRTFLLKENDVAVISEHGYQGNRKTSLEATEWLEWSNRAAGGKIQHGRNGKEVKIGRYFVDGLDNDAKTVYEYNGCVFHGCPSCTKVDDQVPFSNVRMKDAYDSHQLKRVFLENQGYKVEVMWGCEWKVRKEDGDVKDFVQQLNLSKPLIVKEAFRGGRTNAACLFYEADESKGEKIKHIDIVSLYPTVNKHEKYGVGHPEIIVSDFGDIKDYHGIVKCVVKAPDNERFPVLPMSVNGKLLFALCTACANEGEYVYCHHEGPERYLEGTWCTPELHFALDNGYELVKVMEVWHWKEMRAHFFAEFVDTFLKIKTEASGWPAGCETAEQRDAFLDAFWTAEGVRLDADKMVANPGLKAVAKLMLNSFWGKFGMRDSLHTTEFIHQPKKYFDLLRSNIRVIHDIHLVTPDCVMVTHSPHEDFNEGNATSNLAIAAFTTSHARMHLLYMLKKLEDRVLYFDTDSVIYISRPGQWDPEVGCMLGEWDDQLERGESYIRNFMSLGPKTYCYVTDTGRLEMKMKSITQNGFTEDMLEWSDETQQYERSGKSLNRQALIDLLKNKEKVVKVIYPNFLKKDFKKQKIYNVILPKSIRLVYDKRILWSNLTTSPFGTKDSAQQ